MAKRIGTRVSLSEADKQHIASILRSVVEFLNSTKPDARSEPSKLASLLEFLVERSISQQPPKRIEIAHHFQTDEVRVSQDVGRLRNKLLEFNDVWKPEVRFSIPKSGYEVQFELAEPRREEELPVPPNAVSYEIPTLRSGNDNRLAAEFLLESINQQVGTGQLERSHWLERAKEYKLAEASTRDFLGEINSEIVSRQLQIVFDWLDMAKQNRLAEPGTQLFLTEGCLARIVGKERAGKTLEGISRGHGGYGQTALLELMTHRFALQLDLLAPPIEPRIIDSVINSASGSALGRAICAVLAVWYLREKLTDSTDQARLCLSRASIGEAEELKSAKAQPLDYYCAIPTALAFLALEDGTSAEKHLDLIWNGRPPQHQGYPFTSLTYAMDRAFLETCVGKRNADLSDGLIRELKGQARLILGYTRLMLENERAKSTLVTKTKLAKHVKKEDLEKRLLALEEKLKSRCGRALVM